MACVEANEKVEDTGEPPCKKVKSNGDSASGDITDGAQENTGDKSEEKTADKTGKEDSVDKSGNGKTDDNTGKENTGDKTQKENAVEKTEKEDAGDKTEDMEVSTGDSELNETPKKDNVDAKEPALQTELDVGVTEFISDHLPMNGVIKQRWSDFLVREVDLSGNVVKLTNTEVKEEAEQVTVTSLTDLLTEDQFSKLHSLSEKKDPKESLLIPGMDDKERRTEIHRAVKTFYPSLVSNTTEKDGDKLIEIKWKSSQKGGDQRQRWPKSRGEYCKFVLYKENMDTMDCINLISRFSKLRNSYFTYAGTKDKRARTTQRVSIHKVPAEKLLGLNKILRGVVLGNFEYVKEPLKLGDLQGNRFSIVLRNFTGSDEDLKKAMASLRETGFINYYGLQRFGTTSVPTHHVGRALLQSKWSEAIDLILKPRSGDFPEMAAARKEWLKSKNASACLKHLGRRHSIEKFLLEGIQKYSKNDLVSALGNVSRNTRHMYIHGYQSYIWNVVVSKRIKKMGLKPAVGDLVLPRDWKKSSAVLEEGKSSVQPVIITEENIQNYSIHDVVMPLPGYDVIYPKNEAAEWVQEILKKDNLHESQLKNKVKDYSLPGDYRHIVVKPEDTIWEKKSYDDPNKPLVLSDHDVMKEVALETCKDGKLQALVLEFTLPSSCYATMALREVLKGDTAPSSQALNNVS